MMQMKYGRVSFSMNLVHFILYEANSRMSILSFMALLITKCKMTMINNESKMK